MKQTNRLTFAAISFTIITASVPPLFGYIGMDYMIYYSDISADVHNNLVFNPYPFYQLFYPLTLLPPTIGASVWGLINASGLLVLTFNTRQDMGMSLILTTASLPFYWILSEGQMEGIIAWGLVLILSGQPIAIGLGLFIVSLKPQLGVFIIAWYSWHCYQHGKSLNQLSLLIASSLYLPSFVQYGFWLPQFMNDLQLFNQRNALTVFNVSLAPYSYPLLLLLLTNNSLKIWLLGAVLISPYAGVQSLALYASLAPLSLPWHTAFYIAYLLPHPFPYPLLSIVLLMLLIQEIKTADKTPLSDVYLLLDKQSTSNVSS